MEPSEFLNYHHLRYFWMVAREGSLRRAAEKLRVSQPSISTQIRLLERALGEDLFRPRGRSIVLTEFGHVILGYAEEIFTLGGEVLRAARQAPTARPLRLHAGVVDSFPKFLSFAILQPIFEHDPPIQLTCHEGKIGDLLALLLTHRLDVVLADEPASSAGGNEKVFNHPLGRSDIAFCAAPALRRTLTGRFPRNLHHAPALLPTQNTSLRRDLERWFHGAGIQPRLVAEFEDAALAQIVSAAGRGIVAVPSSILPEVKRNYGLVSIGQTSAIQTRFYAITAERRLTHPAILALTTGSVQARTSSRRAPRAAGPRRSQGKRSAAATGRA